MMTTTLSRPAMIVNGPPMNARQAHIFDRIADLKDSPAAITALLEAMSIVGLPQRVSQMTSAQCDWMEDWLDGAERIWGSRAQGRTERIRAMLEAATAEMLALPEKTPRQKGRAIGMRLALDVLWQADEPCQWTAFSLLALLHEADQQASGKTFREFLRLKQGASRQEWAQYDAMVKAVVQTLQQFREAI